MSAAKKNLAARKGRQPVVKTDRDGNTRCRVCGCTQFDACLVGCFWALPGLCSVCNKAAVALANWIEAARRVNWAGLRREAHRRAVVLAAFFFVGSAFGQLLPPPIYTTNDFSIQIFYATDGVHYTNALGAASVVENVSSNGLPWSQGYGANPPGSPWAWVTGYPTNLVVIHWTWEKQNNSTNFLMVTNDPGTTLGTILTFYVYPITATGPVWVFLRVYAPTNKDPGAVLLYSDIVTTNKWHVEGAYNGQFYANTVSDGEYVGPAFWRTSNSTYDPLVKRWKVLYPNTSSNRTIWGWTNTPNW